MKIESSTIISLKVQLTKATKNENYLPEHLKVILDCIKGGLVTSREIAEVNPLAANVKYARIFYGKHLKQLYDIGLLERERNSNDSIFKTGYEYIYSLKKFTTVKLKPNQKIEVDWK